jgi:hypothetical protein
MNQQRLVVYDTGGVRPRRVSKWELDDWRRGAECFTEKISHFGKLRAVTRPEARHVHGMTLHRGGELYRPYRILGNGRSLETSRPDYETHCHYGTLTEVARGAYTWTTATMCVLSAQILSHGHHVQPGVS